MSDKFLCYTDSKGFRGYIPPHTPYILRQISNTKYWLESDSVVAIIVTGTPNTECNHYNDFLGLVSKEEEAIKWLVCGDNSKFIGTNNC